MADKNILVIRLGRTGDIVMITAALKAILKKHPGSKVDILTSPDGKRVLNNFHPDVQVRYVHNRKSLLEYFKRKQIKSAINVAGYDIVYNFELNPSTSQFFPDSVSEIHQLEERRSLINYAESCLELVTGQVSVEHEWTWLPVNDAARQKAKELLKTQGVEDDSFVIGFHPSFSGLKKSYLRSMVHKTEKAWPASRYGELAIKLKNHVDQHNYKLNIIMDLMPEDKELGEKIVAASNGIVKLFIPDLNFERYKAVLERMNILVVPNTGPMHIAGAVGTKLVALFGDIPPEDSGAYVPEEQRAFIHLKGDHTGHGIEAIPVEMVYECCLAFINESSLSA